MRIMVHGRWWWLRNCQWANWRQRERERKREEREREREMKERIERERERERRERELVEAKGQRSRARALPASEGLLARAAKSSPYFVLLFYFIPKRQNGSSLKDKMTQNFLLNRDIYNHSFIHISRFVQTMTLMRLKHTYIHTYIHTYMHTCIVHTYIHTYYIHAYIHDPCINLHAFIHTSKFRTL